MRDTSNPLFRHQLEIMQAINEGKAVQNRHDLDTEWKDYTGPRQEYNYLNFASFRWRIKPAPAIELEVWYNASTDAVFTSNRMNVKRDSYWESLGYVKLKMRQVVEN